MWGVNWSLSSILWMCLWPKFRVLNFLYPANEREMIQRVTVRFPEMTLPFRLSLRPLRLALQLPPIVVVAAGIGFWLRT
jgi:hypothetical protein